jgi:large subunit ribosomal protein L16
MLLPKRTKFRKYFKGKIKGVASRGTVVSFGSFGLKTLEAARLTARQIEAARRVIARQTKRGGKVWIRVFPHLPVTCKSEGVPMGSGKGAVDHYVARVKPGHVLFEIDGISPELVKEAFTLAGHKLPVKTKIISKMH